MRALLQRVSSASVSIEGATRGRIGAGLLVFVAIEATDGESDIAWLSEKITQLRIFPDAAKVMNRSVFEAGGEVLLISQFTLLAVTKKGTRPSWHRSAPPAVALPLYQLLIHRLEADLGKPVQTGEFGAEMSVALVNEGPVTLMIDSKNREL